MKQKVYSIALGVLDAKESIQINNETIDKLKNILPNKWKNTYDRYINNRGPLSVLTHGDLWTNNAMLSYNKNGKIKSIRFVIRFVV